MHKESFVPHVVAAHLVVLVNFSVPHIGSETVSAEPNAIQP